MCLSGLPLRLLMRRIPFTSFLSGLSEPWGSSIWANSRLSFASIRFFFSSSISSCFLRFDSDTNDCGIPYRSVNTLQGGYRRQPSPGPIIYGQPIHFPHPTYSMASAIRRHNAQLAAVNGDYYDIILKSFEFYS
jgi:hypothetical protein